MPLGPFELQAVDAVSRDTLMDVTAGIARWVRLSGSEDEMRAVDYVRDVLERYGWETEIVRHDAYISLPVEASIEIEGGERLPCITHSFAVSTAPDGLTAEVIPADTRQEQDLTGKIALLDGLPSPGQVLDVESRGAAGQIYVHGRLAHEMIVSPVWGSPDPRTLRTLPRTPVVSVDAETGARLRDLAASGTGRVTIRARVDTGWRQTPILIANLTIPGSSDFVLFSGHIDSWHYGAMDNGSANATMVEVARIMAEHRDELCRGLRLAFWSGHSHGRYSGSAWYTDNHWVELRRHCMAHVNVDSVGGRGATVLTEGIATASLRNLGAETIFELSGEVYRGSRVGRAGDQSLIGLGVPSLWMSLSEQPPSDDPTATAFGRLVGESRSGGLGWWWHTPEDTVDKIDPDLLLRDAQIYTAALARLLSSRLLPLSLTAEVREVLELLKSLQETCPSFDLTTASDRAEVLLDEATRLEAWGAEHTEDATDNQAATYNRAVSESVRSLIAVNYTSAGPFAHDRAMPMPALPALARVEELAKLPPGSDEARFLTVGLVRGRNRVVWALEEALESVSSAVDTLA